MKQPVIFVLYDSITNSIFDSQIAELLLKLHQQKAQPTIIISFESMKDRKKLDLICSQYPTIQFIFLKKIRFICQALLYPLIHKLHKILKKFPPYQLIARGPLAGYICSKAMYRTACLEMTIQARGILPEEYRYTHAQTKNSLLQLLHYIRSYLFERLEKAVYCKHHSYTVCTTIEAVSNALKEYLIKQYNADSNMISIAHLDIPAPFPRTTIEQWRKLTRAELHIDENAHVYCYNGSLKPWQCPQETINYFKEQLSKNSSAYLLVLTQDKEQFEQLMQKSFINAQSFKIGTVAHKEIYRYLAACDAGIIFREKNSINWTSRPTKILEYQAVGLPIIHNNSIALLENSI